MTASLMRSLTNGRERVAAPSADDAFDACCSAAWDDDRGVRVLAVLPVDGREYLTPTVPDAVLAAYAHEDDYDAACLVDYLPANLPA